MRVLYAITTYGSAPYVDLSLEMHKRFGNACIVVDDGSGSADLRRVCKKHGVPLIGWCRSRERVPGFGDMVGMVQGIEYAAALGFDLAVKQSRRWICLADPTPSLVELAEKGGSTFSNFTESFDFGFRTEFLGFRVADWEPFVPEISAAIRAGKEQFVEAFIHAIARKVGNGDAGYPFNRSGYTHWAWMGTDRRRPPEHVMWHDYNTPVDYWRKATAAGLEWKMTDFERVNG